MEMVIEFTYRRQGMDKLDILEIVDKFDLQGMNETELYEWMKFIDMRYINFT